jgi:hypothetical protein
MKKIVSIFIIPAIALATVCTSCDKADNQKPVINLIEPEEGDALQIGADVHFEMEITDNEELRSYKVEIHHNFDNHTHAETKATADDSDPVPFAFNKSWDVSGLKNKLEHHHEIVIPANAAEGAYHFMVYCTDAAGNESYVARNIQLSHEAADHDHDHDE